MDTSFTAEVFEWRGPAPFYWVLLPVDAADYVRAQAAEATYGWGAIPVLARIGATEWETSLLPRSGSYALPLRKDVRRKENIGNGAAVAVALTVAPREGRTASGPAPAVQVMKEDR